MKKTLKLVFERRPYHISYFFLNISSIQIRIKLYTENQPLRLLNSEESYEEDNLGFERQPQQNFEFGDYFYEDDLKIRIWNTTST